MMDLTRFYTNQLWFYGEMSVPESVKINLRRKLDNQFNEYLHFVQGMYLSFIEQNVCNLNNFIVMQCSATLATVLSYLAQFIYWLYEQGLHSVLEFKYVLEMHWNFTSVLECNEIEEIYWNLYWNFGLAITAVAKCYLTFTYLKRLPLQDNRVHNHWRTEQFTWCLSNMESKSSFFAHTLLIT